MIKSIDKPNCINDIRTFKGEDTAYGRTSVKCRHSQTVTQ